MKQVSKTNILIFLLLILAASLYRVFPNRPLGFAPQIAMALFAGASIKNKKIAFLFPLLSMFFSDIFYEILYRTGLNEIEGFYKGIVVNYLLFVLLAVIGFYINIKKINHILLGSLASVLIYFLLSNMSVWLFGGLDINNQPYPKTLAGLTNCLIAGLPFLKGSLLSTFTFGGVFFGMYNVVAGKIIHDQFDVLK